MFCGKNVGTLFGTLCNRSEQYLPVGLEELYRRKRYFSARLGNDKNQLGRLPFYH